MKTEPKKRIRPEDAAPMVATEKMVQAIREIILEKDSLQKASTTVLQLHVETALMSPVKYDGVELIVLLCSQIVLREASLMRAEGIIE